MNAHTYDADDDDEEKSVNEANEEAEECINQHAANNAAAFNAMAQQLHNCSGSRHYARVKNDNADISSTEGKTYDGNTKIEKDFE